MENLIQIVFLFCVATKPSMAWRWRCMGSIPWSNRRY